MPHSLNIAYPDSGSAAPEEATFRDASRIGQFLAIGGAQDSRAFAEMLSCFDRSAMVRLCDSKLIQLANGPLAPFADRALAAIIERDTATLRCIARMLHERRGYKGSIEADVAACLVSMSDILDRSRKLAEPDRLRPSD